MITIVEEISFIQNVINTLADGKNRFSSVAYEYSNPWFPLTLDITDEFDASYGSNPSNNVTAR